MVFVEPTSVSPISNHYSGKPPLRTSRANLQQTILYNLLRNVFGRLFETIKYVSQSLPDEEREW